MNVMLSFEVVVKKIALLFLSIIFSLIFCELMAAKFFPQETLNFVKSISPACFEASDFLPFVLKKSTTCYFKQEEFNHAVLINKLGYRNREFDVEKKNGVLRILIVGDSFTFGHGAADDDTYSSQLEKFLQKDFKNIEVINAGHASSFSPDSYYLYLKNLGVKLKPNLVIVGFFIFNDITDLKETIWEKVDSDGLPLKIASAWQKVNEENMLEFRKSKPRYRIPIFKNSHLFQLIYSHKQSFFDKFINFFDKNPGFNPEKESMAIYDACIFLNECFEKKYKDEWERTKKVIMATKKLLDDSGISLLMVLIPTKEQLINNGCCGWQDLGEEEKLSINKRLKEFFKENQISYLDLYFNFKGKSIKNLYYEKDAHWTLEGNLVAAEAIYQYLLKNFNF